MHLNARSGRVLLIGLAAVLPVPVWVGGTAKAALLEPTFLDTITIGGSTYNIGNRPDGDPAANPPNDGTHQPPVMINLLAGPASGLVTGQFRFDNPGAVSLANIAATWDLRWGVIDVTSINPPVGAYVTDGGGNQMFPSNVGATEGFTAFGLGGVQGGSQPPFNTTVEFMFDTSSAGISLVGGHTYVLFALLDKVTNPVPFPAGPSAVPTRTDATPLNPSQMIDIADGLSGPGGLTIQQLFESQINAGSVANMDKIVTGVVLNVVPEPATLGLLGVGAALLLGRRRTS